MIQKECNSKNNYEDIIEKFANDFELEVNDSKNHNISKQIREGNEGLLSDINELIKLGYLIRMGKAKIVIDKDTEA